MEWHHVRRHLEAEKPGLLAKLGVWDVGRRQTQRKFLGGAVLCIGLLTRTCSTARISLQIQRKGFVKNQRKGKEEGSRHACELFFQVGNQ